MLREMERRSRVGADVGGVLLTGLAVAPILVYMGTSHAATYNYWYYQPASRHGGLVVGVRKR